MEERGLSAAVLARGLVRSELRDGEGWIVFNYLRNGREINHKYRTRDKRFRKDPKHPSSLFNEDCLRANPDCVYFVEGEMDALSLIDAGLWNTVSVPDGSPFGDKAPTAEDLTPEKLKERFAYLGPVMDTLRGKRIILALDNDEAGQRLQEVLVHFFGRGRCWIVRWPEDVKDANDYLRLTGAPALRRYVETEAKPYPIAGYYSWSEVLPTATQETFGIRLLDNRVKLSRGTLSLVTGYPNHGKSTFAKTVAIHMIQDHNWGVVMASFEDRVHDELKPELRRIYLGKHPGLCNEIARAECELKLEAKVGFITEQIVPGNGMSEEKVKSFDAAWFMDVMREAHLRQPYDLALLDPWNELEHLWDRGQTETDYIGRILRDMRRVAVELDKHIMIVAHPTKPAAKDENKPPTLYGVSGSANWANKPDIAMVVHRPNFSQPGDTTMDVHVRKVKRHELGERMETTLQYDPQQHVLRG